MVTFCEPTRPSSLWRTPSDLNLERPLFYHGSVQKHVIHFGMSLVFSHIAERFYVSRQNYWNHNVNLTDGEVFVYLFDRGNYPTSLVFMPREVKMSIKWEILFSKFTFGTFCVFYLCPEDCISVVRRTPRNRTTSGREYQAEFMIEKESDKNEYM